MKVQELKKQGAYIWRFKHFNFSGIPNGSYRGLDAPPRIKNEVDKYDYVFDSQEELDKWYKERLIGFAEFDKVMNYCKYFEREIGNDGFYVRDGKKCKVSGHWDGYLVDVEFDKNVTKLFQNFLNENGWRSNWFELMDRYKQ